MIDREGFPSSFSAPHEVDEILELLPLQVTLNVPDHLLSLWFPPGAALERAQSYAQSCGCQFEYNGATREGVFSKVMPREN